VCSQKCKEIGLGSKYKTKIISKEVELDMQEQGLNLISIQQVPYKQLPEIKLDRGCKVCWCYLKNE
jgi:hypothetical protein